MGREDLAPVLALNVARGDLSSGELRVRRGRKSAANRRGFGGNSAGLRQGCLGTGGDLRHDGLGKDVRSSPTFSSPVAILVSGCAMSNSGIPPVRITGPQSSISKVLSLEVDLI